jgi:hypothetical protein
MAARMKGRAFEQAPCGKPAAFQGSMAEQAGPKKTGMSGEAVFW